MKIVILVINYANEEEVLEYAKTISKQTMSKNLTLVIINNKCNENPKVDLNKEIKNIELDISVFDPEGNLGYLNGALYGYREYCKNKLQLPDYAVVSNTDILIPDIRFFEKFILSEYPIEVSCIAPSVVAGNYGTYQNPHYIDRIPKKKIDRVIMIHEYPSFALLYNQLAKMKSRLKRKEKQDSRYVYSPHGCFFFLKQNFIENIKDNYYKGFLYSEESYIAELLIQNNKRCYYDGNIELIHNENSVTGLLGIKKKSKFIADSLKYIKEEFY